MRVHRQGEEEDFDVKTQSKGCSPEMDCASEMRAYHGCMISTICYILLKQDDNIYILEILFRAVFVRRINAMFDNAMVIITFMIIFW